MDQQLRVSRLQTIIRPVTKAWQDPELTEALSTFSGFCRLVGMDQLPQYLSRHNYALPQDWASAVLDDEGKLMQDDMQARTLVSISRLA